MGRRAQQSTGNSELPNTLIIWSGQSWEPPGALIANPGTLWVAENSSFPLCSRYSMAGNRTPIATRFEDRSNKMCKMTPSLFSAIQRLCLCYCRQFDFVFSLSSWVCDDFMCALLLCLPWGCQAFAGDAGEQIFFFFFALLQPRSIKKENPQKQWANKAAPKETLHN